MDTAGTTPLQRPTTSTPQVIDVSAGLVFRDSKLLITQRHDEAHQGGLWEFPGGKCQVGESFEDCLRRELREELGIEVEVLDLIESLTHDYPERSVHLRFFRCAWRRNEPRALDCKNFTWVEREGLDDYTFPAADARLLKLLRLRPACWH